MLLFRSEVDIDNWCENHRRARGHVFNLDEVWRLAKAWYADRLAPELRGRSTQDVDRIFRQLGLTDAFWKLPAR